MVRIAICLAMWIAAAGGALAQDVAQRLITVQGHGEVSASPDMATLSMGVTHTDTDASDAMAQVSENVSRILDRLAREGVAPADIQTRRLTLGPLWSNRPSSTGDDNPRITGFSASNMVMVRIRDLDRVGDILSAVLSDGANEFQGLSFGVQEPGPLSEAARRAAVADGMAQAKLLADAAGVALGPVQSITDQSGMPRPQMMEMAAVRGGSVPVAGGEITVEASVTMVFAIGE